MQSPASAPRNLNLAVAKQAIDDYLPKKEKLAQPEIEFLSQLKENFSRIESAVNAWREKNVLLKELKSKKSLKEKAAFIRETHEKKLSPSSEFNQAAVAAETLQSDQQMAEFIKGNIEVIKKEIKSELEKNLQHVPRFNDLLKFIDKCLDSILLANENQIPAAILNHPKYIYCKLFGGIYLPMAQKHDVLAGKAITADDKWVDTSGSCLGYCADYKNEVEKNGHFQSAGKLQQSTAEALDEQKKGEQLFFSSIDRENDFAQSLDKIMATLSDDAIYLLSFNSDTRGHAMVFRKTPKQGCIELLDPNFGLFVFQYKTTDPNTHFTFDNYQKFKDWFALFFYLTYFKFYNRFYLYQYGTQPQNSSPSIDPARNVDKVLPVFNVSQFINSIQVFLHQAQDAKKDQEKLKHLNQAENFFRHVVNPLFQHADKTELQNANAVLFKLFYANDSDINEEHARLKKYVIDLIQSEINRLEGGFTWFGKSNQKITALQNLQQMIREAPPIQTLASVINQWKMQLQQTGKTYATHEDIFQKQPHFIADLYSWEISPYRMQLLRSIAQTELMLMINDRDWKKVGCDAEIFSPLKTLYQKQPSLPLKDFFALVNKFGSQQKNSNPVMQEFLNILAQINFDNPKMLLDCLKELKRFDKKHFFPTTKTIKTEPISTPFRPF